VYVPDDAATIDQVRGRHGREPERLGEPPLRVAHARVADRPLLEEAARLLRVLVDVDRQDAEALAVELLAELLEQRERRQAGRAPGGPEVDVHHLALVGAERERAVAVERSRREARRAITRLERTNGCGKQQAGDRDEQDADSRAGARS
jgi:ATP-dependent helicase YprA (DUF1998 family)